MIQPGHALHMSNAGSPTPVNTCTRCINTASKYRLHGAALEHDLDKPSLLVYDSEYNACMVLKGLEGSSQLRGLITIWSFPLVPGRRHDATIQTKINVGGGGVKELAMAPASNGSPFRRRRVGSSPALCFFVELDFVSFCFRG